MPPFMKLSAYMLSWKPWDQDGFDRFTIEIQFLKTTTWLLQSGDDEGDDAHALARTIEVVGPAITKSFRFNTRCLLSDLHRPRLVSYILSEMGLSEQANEILEPTISPFAREVALAVSNGAPIALASVHILQTLTERYDENAAIAAASMESMDAGNGGFGAVPASASAIEALEVTKLDVDGGGVGSTSTINCAICLEELPIGSQITRMPCSHVYHGGCISQWLQTSNFCPLCRYEMPKV
ncbi:PREDICTED: RING-H2 finger protein ATL39-like [Nelumbo nucifera]|uniref:RING-H2 finger protein ATL39-like n=1 Tax=Nelumbo nucifera TaxID=4432 RepID=A0A1U8AMC2_NELNU|nr:PREDICTED: RING-H2 finger protein ATL39-like [Nelumbo nucifera]